MKAQRKSLADKQMTGLNNAVGKHAMFLADNRPERISRQKQGNVKSATQLKSIVNVNDDNNLEKEADVMGAKALQTVPVLLKSTDSTGHSVRSKDTIQLKGGNRQYGSKASLNSGKANRKYQERLAKEAGKYENRKPNTSARAQNRNNNRNQRNRRQNHDQEEHETTIPRSRYSPSGSNATMFRYLLVFLILAALAVPVQGAAAQPQVARRRQTDSVPQGVPGSNRVHYGNSTLSNKPIIFQENVYRRGTPVDRGPQFAPHLRYEPNQAKAIYHPAPKNAPKSVPQSPPKIEPKSMLADYLSSDDFDQTAVGKLWNHITNLENFSDGIVKTILKNFSRNEAAAVIKHYPYSWVYHIPNIMLKVYKPVEAAVGRKWEGQQKGNAVRHINWIINADRYSEGNKAFVSDLAEAHEKGRPGSIYDEVADKINNAIGLKVSSLKKHQSASDISEELWANEQLAKNSNFVTGAPSESELKDIAISWKKSMAYLKKIKGPEPEFTAENKKYYQWVTQFAG